VRHDNNLRWWSLGSDSVGGSKLEAGALQEVQLRLTVFNAEYPSIDVHPWSLYIVEALPLAAQLRPIRGFLLTYIQQSAWAVRRRACRDPRLGMGNGGLGGGAHWQVLLRVRIRRANVTWPENLHLMR